MIRFSPRPNRAHLVKWREWSAEVFAEARQVDRPVALFITAFWCGVCQRLDETSLSRDEVIALLNAFFIPVRVEESQRPDIDVRYNQDGWPTIAFLTPQGDHLLSVNYTEPEQFISLLTRVVDYYRQNAEALRESADELPPSSQEAVRDGAPPLTSAIVAEIAGILEGLADPEYGGFGDQAKYLHPEANEFLLYLYEVTGNDTYLKHVSLTLDKMRASRSFDSAGGGFFRYSSRRDWQEPHPEKLLDDQAALLRNYLHLYILTGQPSQRETAESLVAYLNKTLSEGASVPFFGCEDHVRQIAPRGATGPLPVLSFIDRLVYTDANAHAASAYLDAWIVLGLEDCRQRAQAVLDWLWEHHRSPDGGMYHFSDAEPLMPGMLMDSVAMGSALLDAYAALGDEGYLSRACELASHILEAHRNPGGGFYDISYRGPAHLRFPLTMLTQNASTARFFLRLADLSGDQSYREQASWALGCFPNSHREHGAYAAGFGHALARLQSPPLTIVVKGPGPGDAGMLRLLCAALTQLRHANLDFRFELSRGAERASLELHVDGRRVGPVDDPSLLEPQLLSTTS